MTMFCFRLILILTIALAGPAVYGDERAVAQAYDEFKTLLEQEDYENAIPAGRDVLRLAEKSFGEDAAVLIRPVIDLAGAFRSAGLFGTAESYYQRGISLIERAEGVYSPRLIEPLVGMGEAYLEAGRYDEAEDAFRRAQHVVHRKDGVISLEQIAVLDNLTDTYVSRGDIVDADREQRLAYRVTVLKYGKDDPRIVPATLKLAEWFRETGQYSNAGILYRSSVRVLENAYGENDPSIIEPLRGLADARGEHLRHLPPGVTDRGVPVSEGRSALERVLAIVEQEPARNSDQELQALIELGDWYTVMGKSRKALELYRRAWTLLDSFANPDEMREQIFGSPVRLYYNPQNLGGLLPSWKKFRFGEIYIDVAFTVTEEGKTSEIELLESNSPVVVKMAVKKAVHQARYRPRFQEGDPVATERVSFRQVIPTNFQARDTAQYPSFP